MYFLLADIADRFAFLHYGLAFVLSFIGIKMLIVKWAHIPVGVSLIIIFCALGISILYSLLHSRKQQKTKYLPQQTMPV